MRLLAAMRYRVIGFEDLARALLEGRPLPRRTVVITLDDGYEDNLTIAHPILRRRGFPATLFLVSERLGDSNGWDGSGATRGRALLSIEQALQLRADGLELGAHTRTHPRLPELPDEAVVAEISESRTGLESALGEPVRTFAYPYGEFDERAVEAVGQASFLGACTTIAHRARLGDDPLLIPRIEVRGSDTTKRFLRKLWLGGQ
jgi:peptidoglycan/xylan/chitin deacetylase (PgdA/CDA1 family)